jgi:hypothetical protein
VLRRPVLLLLPRAMPRAPLELFMIATARRARQRRIRLWFARFAVIATFSDADDHTDHVLAVAQ